MSRVPNRNRWLSFSNRRSAGGSGLAQLLWAVLLKQGGPFSRTVPVWLLDV